ncbi:uncharacterized protein LOC109539836 [Dendroctonus ponderosae]|uniref:Uncharacterized protein n=1 Tax=Dendroctonus ponderosae TaxID=77166 RepID=A0AAR5PQX9_DENPD|nr:uncharacterized protein LOC109539836 [Dendroctonus ponderosae]KAH1013220.1 hypothetical protein HUJ04_002240 [Dendroctonus ponderosae]KAH1024872.1 hypothetical protein HUJ05_004299 [Dendroctonus ponderosae]
MPNFKLEPIKYNPNDRRTPKMLYSKKQYNEKVKVDNWYMNIEFQPVDINPYNPKCFRLHNSHYNRLGNLDQKTLISEDHDCYRNVSPKTSHFEHNPHKFLINAYSYPYSCPNDQSKQSCPQNDADFTTTMQRSYSSPYPSKIRRLMMPKTGPENKIMKSRDECKFLDDNFVNYTKALQDMKGFRHISSL